MFNCSPQNREGKMEEAQKEDRKQKIQEINFASYYSHRKANS